MLKFLKGLFLTYHFFIALLLVVVLFVIGFILPIFFIVAQAGLALFIAVVILETFVLYVKKNPISGKRIVHNPLSLGDKNTIKIQVQNNYGFTVNLTV